MIKLLPILIVIIFAPMAFSDPIYLVPYTQVQEKEVKTFIEIGMDEREVAKKVGPPNLTDAEKDGSEVWTYLVDPRIAREAHSNYYGFEVFLKNKKVTYLGIIR
jgi:hypothetical protein